MEQELKRNGYDFIKRLYTGQRSQIWTVKKNNTLFGVKIVTKKDGGDTVALRERDILRKLEGHGNILKVFDTIITTDELGLVLEYCSDGNLNDFIVNKSQTPPPLSVMGQILSAIQHVHDNGIVHLDIQPSNFLVKFDSENRMTLKFTGFGQRSRAIGQTTGDDYETNSFSPPAPVDRDDRPTPLTTVDMYAVGAVLYALYDKTVRDGRLVAEFRGRPIREVDEAELGRHVRKMVEDTTIREIITDALIKNPHSRPHAKYVVERFQLNERHERGGRQGTVRKIGFGVAIGMFITVMASAIPFVVSIRGHRRM